MFLTILGKLLLNLLTLLKSVSAVTGGNKGKSDEGKTKTTEATATT
jgi:hypothetical protein